MHWWSQELGEAFVFQPHMSSGPLPVYHMHFMIILQQGCYWTRNLCLQLTTKMQFHFENFLGAMPLHPHYEYKKADECTSPDTNHPTAHTLDILKMYLHTQSEVSSRLSKVRARTDRQTDATERITSRTDGWQETMIRLCALDFLCCTVQITMSLLAVAASDSTLLLHIKQMLKHAECETSLFIHQVSLPGLNYIPFSTSRILNKTVCLQCHDTRFRVERASGCKTRQNSTRSCRWICLCLLSVFDLAVTLTFWPHFAQNSRTSNSTSKLIQILVQTIITYVLWWQNGPQKWTF